MSRDLAAATGASVVHLPRADHVPAPTMDVDYLSRLVRAQPWDDLLILIDDDEARIIPLAQSYDGS